MPGGKQTTPCDHSDEKRLAVLGRHEFKFQDLSKYYTIPIIQVKTPPHVWFTFRDKESHDFALLILKEPVKFSRRVNPICLPHPNQDFGGKKALAAGWGRTDKHSVNPRQSLMLQKVWLTVSTKKYKHKKMFGTVVSKKDNIYQDPCSGDSGTTFHIVVISQESFLQKSNPLLLTPYV